MKSKVALILLAILTMQAIAPAPFARATISVVSVVPSVSKIDDTTVGSVFSIAVTYSAPLDPSDDPTIVLSPDLYSAGTLTYTDSVWSNGDTVYTANFTVADKDEIIPNVDATILGGTEAGTVPAPPLGAYDAPNLFSVDTLTPPAGVASHVVSVTTTAPVINDGLSGQTFSITVTYSAPLDPSDEPTIVLSPDLYGSTLTFTGTTWSNNNTVYSVDCTVNDLNEKIASVDATVIGGTTANTAPPIPLGAYDAPNLFSVDTQGPAVTAGAITTSGATGNGGVYKIGDTVKVSWNNTALSDNNTDIASATVDFSQFGGGASVAATQVGNIWVASYTLPEGTLDNVPNLNPSITVTDSAGNATTVQDDANATVDNKINGYSVAINQAYINTANQTALAFTFANAEVGATYDYDINGIVIGSGIIATPSDMITGIDASSLADGTLTLSAHLTDAAGNVGNTVVALQKPKDTTAPTATAQTSMPAVNLSTVGTQLTVTAKFSEPMNMASMPSISFSPNIISTGTLSLSTMNWVDSKTYQMTYNTHTVPEAQPSVDITVTGGKDQYNNQMASALTAGALSVDTMPLPPPPPPAPTPTPPAPSPSPMPAPTSFTPHASPGDGRQINPNTNEIPGFVAPVVAPAPLAIAPLVEPTFHLTSATLPKAESAGAAPLVTEPTFTPLPTEQVLVPINQPDQSLTNDQLAAAGAAGVDLFSGSKIYLWLLILILLLIFTRVTVALIRREHR